MMSHAAPAAATFVDDERAGGGGLAELLEPRLRVRPGHHVVPHLLQHLRLAFLLPSPAEEVTYPLITALTKKKAKEHCTGAGEMS